MKFYIKSCSSHKLFNILFVIFISFFASLGLVSCSNNTLSAGKSGTTDKKAILHTHPMNECIDAVTHSHINGGKKHFHYFHYCKANAINPNAHTHPSSSAIMGYIRHIHPNGSVKHTHSH